MILSFREIIPAQQDKAEHSRNSNRRCHNHIEQYMAETGPIQRKLNSDTDSDCQHQCSRHAGGKAFPMPAAPAGSQHQAPYQHYSGKYLLEADKTEFQESVIPEAFEQDPAGSAEDQELNPCIPILSPAAQHAYSKYQKQN